MKKKKDKHTTVLKEIWGQEEGISWLNILQMESWIKKLTRKVGEIRKLSKF